MDKQNFYQEKYEYYRTLNLWAVFGISIPRDDVSSGNPVVYRNLCI